MTFVPRFILCALGGSLTLATGAAIQPPLSIAATSLDLLKFPAYPCMVGWEQARGRALSDKIDMVVDDLAWKGRTVDDLLAGTITMSRAVEVFREVGGPSPCLTRRHGDADRGSTPDERAGKEVLRWVKARLVDQSPEKARPFVDRLNADLAALLKGATPEGVTASLPTSPSSSHRHVDRVRDGS
jgi:hypothetical protein